MKKIICIILVLAALFAVTSCGNKNPDPTPTPTPTPDPTPVPEEEVVKDILENSLPTKIVSIVTYVGADILNSIYTTEIDKENNKQIFTYDFMKYGDIAAGDPNRIMNLKGEVYYVNGAVKSATDKSWTTAVDLAPEYKIDATRSLFAEYVVSEDGTTFSGKVKGENIVKVLGVDLSAEEVTIEIMSNGTYIYSMEVSYVTDTGATVMIKTSYTYNNITLDF